MDKLFSTAMCSLTVALLFVTSSAADLAPQPSTLHVLRIRTSENHTASKFIYFTNYGCFLGQYTASHLNEPEPLLDQHAKAYAIAKAPPVATYGAVDSGEVEEYFAPDRYARYERSTLFEAVRGGQCELQEVHRLKVQIAQGTRVINATTNNDETKVSESTAHPMAALQAGSGAVAGVASAWGGGYAAGTVIPLGERTIAGMPCDLVTSSKPAAGLAVTLCAWRGIQEYPTPLGPKKIVLSSETQAPPGSKPNRLTDPIVMDVNEVLHWTEEATLLEIDKPLADNIFKAPQASR